VDRNPKRSPGKWCSTVDTDVTPHSYHLIEQKRTYPASFFGWNDVRRSEIRNLCLLAPLILLSICRRYFAPASAAHYGQGEEIASVRRGMLALQPPPAELMIPSLSGTQGNFHRLAEGASKAPFTDALRAWA
jgi:hypothetical protein